MRVLGTGAEVDAPREGTETDVLGVGAYDNGKLVGLAGCSADCEDMWQIGVDVLPEYRRKGIASALTSTLAKEILKSAGVKNDGWWRLSSLLAVIFVPYDFFSYRAESGPIKAMQCLDHPRTDLLQRS